MRFSLSLDAFPYFLEALPYCLDAFPILLDAFPCVSKCVSLFCKCVSEKKHLMFFEAFTFLEAPLSCMVCLKFLVVKNAPKSHRLSCHFMMVDCHYVQHPCEIWRSAKHSPLSSCQSS